MLKRGGLPRRPRRSSDRGHEQSKCPRGARPHPPARGGCREQAQRLRCSRRASGVRLTEKPIELLDDAISRDAIEGALPDGVTQDARGLRGSPKAEPGRVTRQTEHPCRVVDEALVVKNAEQPPTKIRAASERVEKLRARVPVERQGHGLDREVAPTEIRGHGARTNDRQGTGGWISLLARLGEVDPEISDPDARRQEARMEREGSADRPGRVPRDPVKTVGEEQIDVLDPSTKQEIPNRPSHEVGRRMMRDRGADNLANRSGPSTERPEESVAQRRSSGGSQGSPSPRG